MTDRSAGGSVQQQRKSLMDNKREEDDEMRREQEESRAKDEETTGRRYLQEVTTTAVNTRLLPSNEISASFFSLSLSPCLSLSLFLSVCHSFMLALRKGENNDNK